MGIGGRDGGGVCVLAGRLVSPYRRDLNLCTQSRCGDTPSQWGQNTFSFRIKSLSEDGQAEAGH